MSKALYQDWRKLAGKMVYSFTKEKSEHLKNRVVARNRTRIIFRSGILVSVVFVLIVFPLARLFFEPLGLLGLESKYSLPSGLNSNSLVSSSRFQKAARKQKETSPRAVPLCAGTQFSVEEGRTTSTYRISKGSVRFETQQGDTTKLVVQVGSIVIEDIGTIFSVEILTDTNVRVSVTEGKVLVTWPSGHVELKKGADGTFSSAEFPTPVLNVSGKTKPNAVFNNAGDWRIAARSGNNNRALELIEHHPSQVRNRVDDLLLAADVMRITGRPKRAVVYLNRVVTQFPRDSRRAPAAFTLGKVYLNTLGNPKKAAKAFAIAARNNSPIAEEAKAREAEAWFRAKQPKKARETAKQYLHKFPNGARKDSIRALCNDAL